MKPGLAFLCERRRLRWLACLTTLALLSACASGPPSRPHEIPGSVPAPPPDDGARMATQAEKLLGLPYRWGGAGPADFDCSGLVFFAYQQIGERVPRTVAEQFHAASPVDPNRLRRGDLLFFRESGGDVSHVGIFLGGETFIHAPKSGRAVEYGSLDDEYYRKNFVSAGTLTPALSR